MAAALSKVEPTELHLDHVGFFSRKKDCVVWAGPSDKKETTALQQIVKALSPLFPQLAGHSKLHKPWEELTPHLTLGEWNRREVDTVVQGLQRALAREWDPLAWPIEEVLVLTRSPDPFHVKARIRIGRGKGGESYSIGSPERCLCNQVWGAEYDELVHPAAGGGRDTVDPRERLREEEGLSTGRESLGGGGQTRTLALALPPAMDRGVYGSLGKDREWRRMGCITGKLPVHDQIRHSTTRNGALTLCLFASLSQVRVLQYNLLAESLADGSQRDGSPAPPPCPCAQHFVQVKGSAGIHPYHNPNAVPFEFRARHDLLVWPRRVALIMKEMVQHRPDLICLQEVGSILI